LVGNRRYNKVVKFVVLLFVALGLAVAQDREGNFQIRVEPSAKLQTGAQIPVLITVKDDRQKPLTDAKVTLQIETAERDMVKVYPAPASDVGVYLAKPVFPKAGQWSIYVEVRRSGALTTRNVQFSVPQ
jgi:hypothetical protein